MTILALQVAVYNYMKLQMIRQKAAQSSGKDVEKMGGQEQPLLSNNDSAIKVAADTGPKNGLTFAAYRSAYFLIAYNQLIPGGLMKA